MPLSELHKKKLKKNLTVLAMILLWCALIWAVTMIRMANAHEAGNYYTKAGGGAADNYKKMSEGEIQGVYLKPRAAHLEKLQDTHEQWVGDYHDKAANRDAVSTQREEQRFTHRDNLVRTHESWVDGYYAGEGERIARDDERERQREDHFADLHDKPQNWWDDWATRQPYDQPHDQ